MEDLFKKFLYTGVGLVAQTAEKAKKSIDELVEKGKLSQEDGKKIVDDLYRDAEHKKDEFESKLKNFVEKALDKMNLAKAESVDKLEKRIKSLEVKLGLLSKEADNKAEKTTEVAKTATKKVKEAAEA